MPMIIDGSNGVSFPDSTLQATAASLNMVIITSTQTWTVPVGVTKARVTVIGGGGAGGDSSTTVISGGSGGCAIAMVSGLTGTYSVTVGTGGTGSNTAQGGSGGTSSFGSLLSATGGTGSIGSTAGSSGTGTVTSGTVIRQTAGNRGVPAYVDGGVNPNAASATAPVVYSVSAGFGAGQPGRSELSNNNTSSGGVGGVVIIEY